MTVLNVYLKKTVACLLASLVPTALASNVSMAQAPEPAETQVKKKVEQAKAENPITDLTAESAVPAGDIMAVLEEDGNYTWLIGALGRTELDQPLEGKGPFTVLAPTDKVVSNQQMKDELESMDRRALTELLRTHLLIGKFSQRKAAEIARKAARDAIADAEALAERVAELEAKQTERGLVLTLGDILFDFDKASLKPGGRRAVRELATFLKDYPERTVVIEGFTDNIGSTGYNLDLSERRAQSVESALIAEGLAPSRIQTYGFGEAYPVASIEST